MDWMEATTSGKKSIKDERMLRSGWRWVSIFLNVGGWWRAWTLSWKLFKKFEFLRSEIALNDNFNIQINLSIASKPPLWLGVSQPLSRRFCWRSNPHTTLGCRPSCATTCLRRLGPERNAQKLEEEEPRISSTLFRLFSRAGWLSLRRFMPPASRSASLS